jgi:predicted RNase H-like HicB family nuclease
VVADAQEFISRKIDLVEPEDLEPPPEEDPPTESDVSVSSSQADSPEEALKMGSNAIASGASGQGVRLSHVASYQPVGKFDSFPAQTYAEVFAELDEAIIGDDFLTAKELENLAEHMEDVSGKFSNFGYLDDSRASGLEGAMRQPLSADMDPDSEYDGLERNISGLQMKAFSEFIKRYSSHLGEKALGRAHFEETHDGKRAKGGEVLDLSAPPPPKDAEFALTGVSDKSSGAPMVQGSAEQMAEMAAKTLANGQVSGADAKPGSIKVRGGGTAPGGRGAGMGAGAGQGVAAPKILPRASGGEYLSLEGKLSDGKSVVRLIDAQGRRSLGVQSGKSDDGLTYQEVFVEYAQGAEAELNGEQVPVHMRDYIREYFRSIRPKAP